MTQRNALRFSRLWLAGLALALLSACANTLAVKVTRFNQWPTDTAGASFRFTPADPPRALELQAYQAQVAAALQAQGLRAAADSETARFTVDVQADLSERQRDRLVPVYSDNWVYRPAWRDVDGRWYSGHWVPDPLGARYVGDRTVTQTVQRSQLQLRISENGTGNGPRGVFEATAVHEGSETDLVAVVPYLVSGIFQDFPGANGQVRRLSFELPGR